MTVKRPSDASPVLGLPTKRQKRDNNPAEASPPTQSEGAFKKVDRRSRERSSDESAAQVLPKLKEMAAIEEASSFEYYYWGFPGNPKLLARSNPEPWIRPPDQSIDSFVSPAKKFAFIVAYHHPLRKKLQQGLRDKIRGVLATMTPCKWISVDYLRIGYNGNEEQQNPVVVLVTVEEGQVSVAEAQRIVDALASECMKVDLPDVEVEIKESQREEFYSGQDEELYSGLDGHEPLPMPTTYSCIGASIAISKAKGCGTLGGYVSVDGEVMGLTCHHVAFGDNRYEAYPTTEEEANGVSYTFCQPAERDLEASITDYDDIITTSRVELDKAKLAKVQREDEERMKGKNEARDNKERKEREADNISYWTDRVLKLEAELSELKLWRSDKSILGEVCRSSGLRRCKSSRFRADWALIKLDYSTRFSGPRELVNQIPDYYSFNETKKPRSVRYAMSEAAEKKTLADMPHSLKRRLTFQEAQNMQLVADAKDAKFVVWKFGRSTHFTFGLVSHIETDYRSTSGIVSDEISVVDYRKPDIGTVFSKKGDSGSFVWDSDGYVIGQLWGGLENRFITWVTPMEYILEDIRLACNAKDVRLVVRREDDIDVAFGPSDQQPSTLPARMAQESSAVTVPSLFNDDMKGNLGAESEYGSSTSAI